MSYLKPYQKKALTFIRNAIVHEGHSPSLQKIADVMGYQSRNSAAQIVEKLIQEGYLYRKEDKTLQLLSFPMEKRIHASTIQVPLVGTASCGLPLWAEQNIEATFSVSTKLAKPSYTYFILRANGDSMNRAGIDDKALVLVRQQSTANAGDRVVALINDEATIKEFHPHTDTITLMPRSTNPAHRPIILDSEFQIQGVVTAVLPPELEM